MTRLRKLKEGFIKLTSFEKHERMIELIALITEYFEQDKIQPIIVGGLSVEIYTRQSKRTNETFF